MASGEGELAFGSVGVWLQRYMDYDVLRAVSREAEELGYGTVWVSGGVDAGVFDAIDAVLEATENITIATGVVNLWAETPESVTRAWHRYEEVYPGRVYMGLGISHAPLVEGSLTAEYARPLTKTAAFLDALDAQPNPLPPGRRLLGALGPKMLKLAADRTLGTHPYLASPDNIAQAREAVGGAFVAPELGVILDPDLESARAVARASLELYLGLPNYTRNWFRSGFTEKDLANGGSDQLLDSVFAIGDASAVAKRVAEYRAAGADHIAFQILGEHPDYSHVLRTLASM